MDCDGKPCAQRSRKVNWYLELPRLPYFGSIEICKSAPRDPPNRDHPYLVQPTLLQLAKSEGIAVTAYSSFGPQSFIELEWQKAKDTPVLFEHPVIIAIAEKHKNTPAQILLRWATQRGLAVIPKSNNPQRLSRNLEVTGFDLEEKELESISGLDRHLRFNNPTDVSHLSYHLYFL